MMAGSLSTRAKGDNMGRVGGRRDSARIHNEQEAIVAKMKSMPRPVSPIPKTFSSEKEREYWHMAQDIAYGAGVAILEREGASWLVLPDGERLIYRPTEDGVLWWQTWLRLKELYPEMARYWVGGRAITDRGEL